MKRLNCIVMGAAGRDFHDFLTFFKGRSDLMVRAFTASQIPFIENRSFSQELAGRGYDADIPIFPEERLPVLIAELDVEFVFLCYSDLSHEEVMHKASLVQASGASFVLLGPRHTTLPASRPVISVTASRTGAGKSPLSRAIARHLKSQGRRVVVLRHPMPYGDLRRQVVQRFATAEDLDRHDCTVEEREEFEPYVEAGIVVYAGIDYRAVLQEAEPEADVLVWDGGNNDTAFVKSDLRIVVVDALRPGHERKYYPGETNLLLAQVLVINKVRSARAEDLPRLRESLRQANPRAELVESDLTLEADAPERITGRRVLVVEDGPTLTHGGMAFGAGTLAARRWGAAEIVDPRPHAVGTIARAFREYAHIGPVLPALGYSKHQCLELQETIVAAGADVVIDASPARLEGVIDAGGIPFVRVRYEFEQVSGRSLFGMVDEALERAR